MPRNVYAEIHLHITWHTKRNDSLIVDDIERQLYQYLSRRIAEAEEVSLHAIGGVADHVHLAVTVPPTLHVSDWIGQLKGASDTTSIIESSTASFSNGRQATAW